MGLLSSAVALILSIAFPALTYADTAPVWGSTGGSLKLYNNENVRMVSETIDMTIVNEEWASASFYFSMSPAHIQVDYVFQNLTNQPLTILAAFPEQRKEWAEPLYNFKTYINSQEVLTNEVPNGAENIDGEKNFDSTIKSWHYFPMSFAPNEILRVRNSYEQGPIGAEGSTGFLAQYSYILTTGGSWHGNIDSIDIKINLSGKNTDFHYVTKLQPVYPDNLWKVSDDGKTLELSLKNIKPTESDNLILEFESLGNDRLGCSRKFQGPEATEDTPLVAVATSKKSPDIDEEEYYFAYYFPCTAFDGTNSTAWISADGESPLNQHLLLKYFDPVSYFLAKSQPQIFDSVYFLGGWEKTNKNIGRGAIYTDYSRPKKIKLAFLNSNKVLYSANFELPDDPNGITFRLPQMIKLIPGLDNSDIQVDIQILDIYPGSKYQNVAISEFDIRRYLGDTFTEESLKENNDRIPNFLVNNPDDNSPTDMSNKLINNRLILALIALGSVFLLFINRKMKKTN